MKQKMINSQMSNFYTYHFLLKQMKALAENVLLIKRVPDTINTKFLNQKLLRHGKVAFFWEKDIGLLCLPFKTIGKPNIYGEPIRIEVYGANGFRRTLEYNEFIIMYDNNSMETIYLDICQYAERLSHTRRVTDINISQQKTPRFWRTKKGNEKSLRDMLNNIDSMEEVIAVYESLLLDDTTLHLEPAPFLADKLTDYFNNLWGEYLRLIGIANITIQKKERLLTDEMTASMGGTIASRFSRFSPREDAIEKINRKWQTEMYVEFYDGLPTTLVDNSEDTIQDTNINNDNGGDDNVF